MSIRTSFLFAASILALAQAAPAAAQITADDPAPATSATTCSPMSRCCPATAGGWPTAARG